MSRASYAGSFHGGPQSVASSTRRARPRSRSRDQLNTAHLHSNRPGSRWWIFMHSPKDSLEASYVFTGSRQPAQPTISATATTHPTTGQTTTWKFTWQGMQQHARAWCRYEAGFSSPDTSTFYLIWTKSSDTWTRTIGSIGTRLSTPRTIWSSLSH